MKLTVIACMFSILSFTSVSAQKTSPQQNMEHAFKTCSKITNNQKRLGCYDQLNKTYTELETSTDHKHTSAQIIEKQTFPALIADLYETNLQISYGQLDFLSNQNAAFLMGVGKRQSVKTFQSGKNKPITFNVFGQISSQFDVDQLSTRNNRGGALINTDFSIGGELVQNLDQWSWRLSYTHKSTHLGDEFLIDNPAYQEQRLNLSYETVRWTALKSINNWDLYAGVGFVTRSEPGKLGKSMWQAGTQYKGQNNWFGWPQIKPVLGIDLKSWQASDWVINATFRAGIEVDKLTDLPFQLLFEYQDGHSPYGQFYTDDLSFWGLTFLQNW